MAVSVAVGRLLRACVRDVAGPSGPLGPPRGRGPDYRGLADAAWFHGVAGYAHRCLRDADWVPTAELTALEELRNGAAHGHLQALATLRRLRETLDPAGIDWLVVKGPVLSERLHGSPALRAYSDVDVLVPAEQFEEALRALVGDGARPRVRSWRELAAELSGELQIELAGGGIVDLHWHLLSQRSLRQAFAVPTSELLARSQPVPLGGAPARTLDPADTLLHLCLHTMLSGGNRLVWLKDIERAVARGDAGWDEVADRAAAWRAELAVGAALDLARRVLGAPVPREVIESLAPPWGWRGLVAGATVLSPVERASPGGSLGRIVCRATRASSTASFRELARRSAAFARDAAVRQRDRRQRTVPASGAAEAQARAAFLAAVATSGDP